MFGEKPLGIFKLDELKTSEEGLTTWEAMEKRELQLLVTHPPSNIYEEMIQWTEKGILWKFPINNEQGLLFYVICFCFFVLNYISSERMMIVFCTIILLN